MATVQVVEVRLLGEVEVVAGGRVVAFSRAKERALVAALALRVGQVVSESRLCEALWGEDPPDTAERALQTHVSRVRKALGPAGAVIETHPGGYRLAAEGTQLDVARAEGLLARARAASNPESAVALLGEAGGLWRGRSLGDLDGEPFTGEAARLEELRLVITEERVDAELALGRHATVIAELEALCAEHPLRERLWSSRMLALYRAGRQAEALRAYQDLRARLGEELGLDPSEELRELDAAIARRDPLLARTAPDAAPTSPETPLPTGVVTFLLTDVEGSTALWEAYPHAMAPALARHDEVAAHAVASHGGVLLKSRGEGDSTFSVFASVSNAGAAAIELQAAMAVDAPPDVIPLRVRASVHSGEAELRDGDYFGPTVNRAARLRAIAHGGQVLCSQSSAQLLEDRLPNGATLRSLGSHRLQDLSRPEVVFQLCHPTLQTEFPPPQSLEALPNNLPVQLTSFVGRRQEMEEVRQLLGEHRLVTLTGAAGCGKTRLALQLGAECVVDYRDGVWLVDLAPLADPELLVQTAATALGVREAPTNVVSAMAPQAPRSLGELVIDHLRGRQVLIVLDNCEHLLDAVAAFSEGVLRACPHSRILGTSREPLGVSGEVTWRVRSLSVPDRHQPASPAALRDYEAVRLFVDRAKACVPSFDLTERDSPAVAQICRRLDGIPLAIELAASRVEALAPAELAERLNDRFRVLTGGSRSGLERHQTLRAAIDWSYDALPAPERTLLERLPVFAGGCTLAAAEAVCAGGDLQPGDVLDLLSRLVAKSLVVMDRESTPARYRMLETIRQYARDKLESDEAGALRARHLEWCVAFTERAARGAWGAEQMGWFDALEAEEDNLRQALEWTIDGGDAEHALRLTGALGRFWMVRRRVDEGLRWTLEALALDTAAFPYIRAHSLITAAFMLVGYFGAYDDASRLAEESLELFRQLGVRRGTFWALHTASVAALFKGEIDTAVAAGDKALAVARDTGDRVSLAYALLNRADIAIAEADFDNVTTLLAEAHPILRRLDDSIGLVRLLGIQGYVAIRAGRYAEAIPYLEETVAQSSQIGDAAAVVWALTNLGSVTLVTGDHVAARRWFDKALSASSPGTSATKASTWLPYGEVGPGLARHYNRTVDAGGLGLARHQQLLREADATRGPERGLGMPVSAGSPPGHEPGAEAATGHGDPISHRWSWLMGSPDTPTMESAFLDIFLLNGLAELALADGDFAGAATTFEQALGRLHPVGRDNVLASTTIPGSAVAERTGGREPTFVNAFGMPAGESRLVTERPQRRSPGGALGAGMPAQEVAAMSALADTTPSNTPTASSYQRRPGHASENGTWVGTFVGLAAPTAGSLYVGVLSAQQIAADRARTPPTVGSFSAAAHGGSSNVGEHVLVPSILAGVAKLAVVGGAQERAARLFGASEHLRGSIASLHRQGRWILFEYHYDEMVGQARAALGSDAYDAAFSDGHTMTSDAAIDYARQTVREWS